MPPIAAPARDETLVRIDEPQLGESGAPLATPAHPKISTIGTMAVLFEAPGAFELSQQKRIWSLADEVATWPDVIEVAPGVTNLMAVFSKPPRDIDFCKAALVAAWDRAPEKDVSGRVIEIPVAYGGELGFDLPATAAYTGLSPEEIIHIHSEGDYTVCALGSSPGFGYLHGLDPRIFMPRKSVPSMRMLKGSVTIGGMQTGVSVSTGPNGWNAIGWASVSMFDPDRDPPALLRPGDKLRFLIESITL
jgi:KipI family sensor histidine kinase inhibitor